MLAAARAARIQKHHSHSQQLADAFIVTQHPRWQSNFPNAFYW
jgi:hypothetical protein